MTRKLHISDDLSLPLETVTQAIGILAKRRAGKSYAMRRLVEQLFKAGQQVVLVDPKGDQWGIRSSPDGRSPGLPIVILGGERADVPLEVHSGEVVAKLVVEDRVSVLLDLSLFRKNEVAVFMSAFLENVYRLKAKEVYRTPMMLVIDEADAIAPQKPFKGEERMLGAAEDIVRRGGQRGIGCTLVTQRSAVLNKNVLTQVQLLVVLRTIAPQDLAAIDAWIDVHGTDAERKLLKASLPSLPIGDAWFWSPGWPTNEGIFKRVHVSPIETFDSAATPKPGEKRIEPKNLADVDLDVLKTQMAATIEKARADNPKELKKRIAELERDARKPQGKQSEPIGSGNLNALSRQIGKMRIALGEAMKFIVKINAKDFTGDGIDESAVKSAIGAAMGEIKKSIAAKLTARDKEVQQLRREGSAIVRKLAALTGDQEVEIDVTVQHNQPFTIAPTPRRMPERAPVAVNGDFRASSSQQRILDSLAWAESIGLPEMVKTQLALMSDQSPTSGGYFNNLGSLRTAGLLDYPSAGNVALTEAGRAQANSGNAPTTNEELHNQICAKLSGSQQTILRELISAYPEAVKKDDLAGRVGQSPTSGGYFNNLGRLRTLKLIHYPQSGYAVATPILFIE